MSPIGATKTKVTNKTSKHPDAYTRLNQPRDSYLTTYELAKELGDWMEAHGHRGTLPYPEKILRWCRSWFGELPAERMGGRAKGYRIPPIYRYVARAWVHVEDPQTREVIKTVILADLKPWVVVLGKFGSTHYNADEVMDRMRQVLPGVQNRKGVVRIVNVGPMEEAKT